MYRLFESVKIDNGKIMHLEYHQQRVSRSLSGCGIDLKKEIETAVADPLSGITIPPEGVHKLRITYSLENGMEKIAVIPYIRREIKTLKLITCDIIEYPVKSEERTLLDKLFSQRDECDDILIIKNGKITDTSFSNIIFLKNGEWYTPDTPLLQGTCRSRLLKEGKIKECTITPENLREYTGFRLINALL